MHNLLKSSGITGGNALLAVGFCSLMAHAAWGGATMVSTNATGIVYDIPSWTKSDDHETKTVRLAWPGKTLADIVAIKGTMAGGWIGGSYSVDGLIYDRTDESFKVQFQCVDSSWGGNKVVRAELAQTDDGVTIQLTGAGVASLAIGKIQPDSIFGGLTPVGSNGYGVKGVEAYGETYEVAEFPQPTSGSIVISNGTLRVKIASDVGSSAAISGNGRLALVTTSSVTRTASYSEAVLPKDASWVIVLADAELKDVSLTGGTFGGSWVDGTKACTAYNAVAQSDGSIIVQMQRLSWGDSRCIRVQYRQVGANIQARGIDSYGTAGSHLGEDATKWTKNVAFAGGYYTIPSLSFSRGGPYGVTLRGAKTWTGGATVDGVRLNVRDSILPDHSTVKVVNGGVLGLSVPNAFDHYPHNTYDLASGTQLLINGFDAVNATDAVIADAAAIRVVSDNRVYLNTLTLKNGATLSGYAVRVGNVEPAVWMSSGALPITVSAPVESVRSTSETWTFDAEADMTLSGNVFELSSNKAMPIIKTGSGKVMFSGTVTSTGNLTLNGGTLSVGSALTAAGLVLCDDSTLEIAAGKQALFGDSSALVWTTGKILTLAGSFGRTDQTLRVGTHANGLTRTQLKAICQGEKKATTDEQGWIRMAAGGFAIIIR